MADAKIGGEIGEWHFRLVAIGRFSLAGLQSRIHDWSSVLGGGFFALWHAKDQHKQDHQESEQQEFLDGEASARRCNADWWRMDFQGGYGV